MRTSAELGYLAALAALVVVGLAMLRAAGGYRGGTAWRGSYTPIGPNPGTSIEASTPQP